MKTLSFAITVGIFGFSYIATRMYMCAFDLVVSAFLGALTVLGIVTCTVAAFAAFTNLIEGQDRYEIEVVRKKKGQCDDPLRKWTH